MRKYWIIVLMQRIVEGIGNVQIGKEVDKYESIC